MIKEVAFIAIAVSDKERARKFYQETLELKPSTTGKGSVKQSYGYSITHLAHWPPMGGATHDATPEWIGVLASLPAKYGRG